MTSGSLEHPDPSWCARLRARPALRAEAPVAPSGGRGSAVDRADFDPDYDPAAPVICELCGAVMRYTASCKISCGNCGYRRDCSDP